MDFKDLRVYLSGPIEASNDPNSWRNELTAKLEPLGFKVWSPLIKPKWMSNVDGFIQSKWKTELLEDNYANKESIKIANKQIRDVCLALTRSCDLMIVKIDKNIFTVGTWEEVVVARQLNKPVLCICDNIPSMWLVDMLNAYDAPTNYFFETQDKLIKYLECLKNDIISVDNIEWISKTY